MMTTMLIDHIYLLDSILFRPQRTKSSARRR
ncbi:hypothetical protein MJO28_012737 [Puccinia striiformis f. sp. tritici]|uniref:Uncharacterized protein n=1 Tax=Puccinia striiformis f. sp. tritici TaxID=168172 RepID=A0ACC0E2W9_9BASI|nr:hypothetical protein MJO28_012737 [Puccinia striiformis f. sp. tritici]